MKKNNNLFSIPSRLTDKFSDFEGEMSDSNTGLTNKESKVIEDTLREKYDTQRAANINMSFIVGDNE